LNFLSRERATARRGPTKSSDRSGLCNRQIVGRGTAAELRIGKVAEAAKQGGVVFGNRSEDHARPRVILGYEPQVGVLRADQPVPAS
jgi:hypothetical protein